MDDAADDNTGGQAPREGGVNMDIDENLGGDLGLANEAEDGDDESFNTEDVSTGDISADDDDDELEYDSDDDDDDDDDVEMKPRGYTPSNVTGATLGEDSHGLLYWRESEETFSDWKIKVVAETEEGGNENSRVYSVHRAVLAMGPKKSGYFEVLFNGSSESMNTVKLSADVAAQFPVFLDFMYSQPIESRALVTFSTWKSMAYLAIYLEDVMRFVETDMYNLDHMETYLSEFDGIDDDMSKRILPKAARVCAEMIQSIQVDSSLLKSIPPTMFLSIISTIQRSGSFESASDEDRDHVHGLVIGYLERIEEKSFHLPEHIDKYFYMLLDSMSLKFFGYDDVKVAGKRALGWLTLMRSKGWNSSWLELVCTDFLRKYLNSQEPSVDLIDTIVREVPNDVVTNLFRESLMERRTAEVQQEQETMDLRFDITLFRNGDRLQLGEWRLPSVDLTRPVVDLKFILRRMFELPLSGCDVIFTHNGVGMALTAPISRYVSPEDNLIKVGWKVPIYST